MATYSEMQTATDKAVVNMDRFDRFVNGDATTDVEIDDGTLPSLRKALLDLPEAVSDEVAEAIVATAADRAQTAADVVVANQKAADATYQAGVATTQAGNAASSAAAANSASVAAAGQAQNAALAAATAPNIYADTASGIAAVADGATFWVATSPDTLTLYRRSGSTATLIMTQQSAGFGVARIVQTYGDRASIPAAQRFPGMMVWVAEDKRWFTLDASDLTNSGWKTPSWLTPLQQGTIAERNNRVGGYPDWPKRGMRFLQTDVQPNVLWEYRLAGDPSGPFPDSPAMEADDWVAIPQASDLLRVTPRIVQTYGDRGSIPAAQRFAGMMVWVVEDQRWFTLDASDLTNTGWKRPSWLTPLTQGTIAERNNRIGGYDDWPKRGMRFLQTDVQPNVLWEYRLAGDPSGPFADSPVMTANDWVVIPQARDLLGLTIASFEARALSSGANIVADLRWSITGTQPTTQTVSWGKTSVVLPGGVTSYSPKDWSTPQSLFVAGNSLSDSTDVTDRWSQLLAADLGVPLYSVARYTSDWRQVYRAGVVPLYLTISGGVLPAGGTSASISLINGVAPSSDPGVNPASFLNTGDAGLTTGVSMTGTIVDGANTRRVTVSIPHAASTAYSIVAEAGSAALTLSGAVLFIPDVAKHNASSWNVLWIGNNYFYSGVPNFYGDHTNPVLWQDMAKLVAGAQGNRTLILPVIPDTSFTLGGEVYNAMLAANARTEALYPNLYARSTDGRDLLKYLQDHGDGSAGDNSDIANGWTPRSLRRTGDSLHLNAAGDAVVFAFVKEALARQALPSAITADTVFSLTATGSVSYGVGYETETATTSDTAVATLSAAPAAYLPAIVSNSEPSVAGPALWFKTNTGSSIATLWVKA